MFIFQFPQIIFVHDAAAAAAAKLLQSCPTLCYPRDSSPPGSPSLGFSRQDTGVGCHFLLQCRKVESESEVPQSCPTLSDPMDCSPPGSSIHGICQAKVLEWGAIAFSVLCMQKVANLYFTKELIQKCREAAVLYYLSWLFC